MDSAESKKLAVLRILQILERRSDANHLLTQQDIINLLEKEHGIFVDRKTIGRNLALLKESGFDIIQTRSGSYLKTREFDDFELRVLIDGVLNNKNISTRRSKELIKKICGLSNVYFKAHTEHINSTARKKNNKTFFYTLRLIDEAIDNSKQIEYDLNKYKADGKLHKIARQRVRPREFIITGGNYYLIGYDEYWGEPICHQIDRITNISVLEIPPSNDKSAGNIKNGLYHNDVFQRAGFFPDNKRTIEFLADIEIIDKLIGCFGNEIKIQETNDKNMLRARIKTFPPVMERYALENLNRIEILSPKSLRKKIKNLIKSGVKKYR